MKNFDIKVSRVDHYEIEIDETIWNDEKIAKWSDKNWLIESLDDLVKTVAKLIHQHGATTKIPRFGYLHTYYGDGKQMPYNGKNKCRGIKVRIIDREYPIKINQANN